MNDCDGLFEEFGWSEKRIDEEAYASCTPYKGVFELTPRCNLQCNMCYVRLDDDHARMIGRELTNEEWLRIAEEAKAEGLLYLTLTGGEVFVRPHFRELYEALSRMGFLIQIFSNGYCVDESVMEWLKEKPPYCMRFTLYGVTDETYEAVCGCKEGFRHIDHAIDLMKEAGIPLYMVGLIVKENEKEARSMYEYAARKKVHFRHTVGVVKAVRGATQDVEAHRLEFAEATEEEKRRVVKCERMIPKFSHPLEMCGSYRKAFWLTWNGDLQLCSFMSAPKVSLLSESFSEGWKELQTALARLQSPRKCKTCTYEGFCRRCPGVLAAECGDPEAVTPSFCETARRMYELFYDKGESTNEEKIHCSDTTEN